MLHRIDCEQLYEHSNNEKKDVGFDAMKIAIYSTQVLKTVRLKVSLWDFALILQMQLNL